MSLIEVFAVLIALMAAVGWVNARFLRVPTSIAMVGAGVAGAAALLAAQSLIGPFWGFSDVGAMVRRLDFGKAVLGYFLGFLLFAGGLQVDLGEMRRRRIAIWTLATLGVLISTALVGFGIWLAAKALGFPLPLAWALAFGALISPTDAVAVLGAARGDGLSARLAAVLQGEALFNDGVGFVVFTAALGFVAGGEVPHPMAAVGAIVLEAGGGLALGVVAARGVAWALRSVDDYVAEVTATIALAVGVYVLAGLVRLSGPIAAAAAGLTMGGSGLKTAMSAHTRAHVEAFWDLVDQILNAALFLLLGLQVFVLPFDVREVGLWIVAPALCLGARLLVVLPWGAFFHFRHEERGASLILTWGGLRGAISLALALSLPAGPYKETLLATTFIVVIFSVVIQGLTFQPLAVRLGGAAKPAD
ncbi:MAG: cation:proton antiporter [Caulobacteraceae bacterium]